MPSASSWPSGGAHEKPPPKPTNDVCDARTPGAGVLRMVVPLNDIRKGGWPSPRWAGRGYARLPAGVERAPSLAPPTRAARRNPLPVQHLPRPGFGPFLEDLLPGTAQISGRPRPVGGTHTRKRLVYDEPALERRRWYWNHASHLHGYAPSPRFGRGYVTPRRFSPNYNVARDALSARRFAIIVRPSATLAHREPLRR